MQKDVHRLTRPEAICLTLETAALVAVAFLSHDHFSNPFIAIFIPYILHMTSNNFIKNYFKEKQDYEEESRLSTWELLQKYLFDEPIRKPLGFDWVKKISGQV